MDVYKALSELHEEKQRLDAAISALEARMKTISKKGSRSRRGRRSMSAAEREEVSRRMSRYWASRRTNNQLSATAGASRASEPDSTNLLAVGEVA